jgi:GNAT superfamily N-acetyltransferase
MYEVRLHNFLSYALRRKVDHLIHHVWSDEARRAGDVELLVNRGESVIDELDLLSTHILVFKKPSQLIGYGRISLVSSKNLPDELRDDADVMLDGSSAYLSRMVVHPNYQGLGISKSIHGARLKVAQAWGAEQVVGWAVGGRPSDNLSHLGFIQIKKKQGFRCAWYKTSRTAILMAYEVGNLRSQTSTYAFKLAN